jgi:hypothetical protein
MKIVTNLDRECLLKRMAEYPSTPHNNPCLAVYHLTPPINPHFIELLFVDKTFFNTTIFVNKWSQNVGQLNWALPFPRIGLHWPLFEKYIQGRNLNLLKFYACCRCLGFKDLNIFFPNLQL